MNRHTGLQSGFTLIELITVITVMAVLSTIGIASLVSYSRIQALNTATQDVVNMLQVGKASASSQLKPSTCTPGVLLGYQVDIEVSAGTYSLAPLCDVLDYDAQKTSTLPRHVTFGESNTIVFYTITGNVTFTSASITLRHDEIPALTKTITVASDGRIHAQ